jgi:hypothetical protein
MSRYIKASRKNCPFIFEQNSRLALTHEHRDLGRVVVWMENTIDLPQTLKTQNSCLYTQIVSPLISSQSNYVFFNRLQIRYISFPLHEDILAGFGLRFRFYEVWNKLNFQIT